MNAVKLGDKNIKDTIGIIKNAFNQFKDINKEENKTMEEFVGYITTKKLFKQGITTFWGVYKKSSLVGVMTTKRINHITFLFTKEENHNEEIIRSLFKKVMEHCRKNNMNTITVNSLPHQAHMYRKLGFEDVTIEFEEDNFKIIPMIYKIKTNHWVHRYTIL